MHGEYRYLIGNQWKASGTILEVRSPFNHDLVGTTFLATEADANNAIQAAVHAFEETRKLPGFKRAEILGNIRDGIEKKSEAFARMIALEAGKPIADPLDERTRLGPMIDEQAARKIESWVNEAVKEGAGLLCGGRRNGTFYEPTVITHTTSRMKVTADEVFAPAVTVSRHDTFEEAVRQVNDSVCGLQASVFTNNLRHVFYAYEHLEVGGVIINDVPSFRADTMPYGGVKQSGAGREGVRYAMEEMTEPKLLVLHLS